MKRQTLRKRTSVQRIEMNRFWNDLEEVFDRLDDISIDKCSSIEEAQNILNETIECDREVETAFARVSDTIASCWRSGHDDNDSAADVSGYSSHYEDDDDDNDDSCLSSPSCQDDSLLESRENYISFKY